jgi:hypothetical protein
MHLTPLLPALSGLLLIVSAGVIGIRLLVLWQRTRALPAFLVGFGLCCIPPAELAITPILGR